MNSMLQWLIACRRGALARLAVFVSVAGLAAAAAAQQPEAERPDFDRDVRPILSDKCFRCHGPDENQRQAEFRLDEREAVFADLGGYSAVVPGRPDESELIRRIRSEDPAERMPPPESKIDLEPHEITMLGRWVATGAHWSEHWSFVPPRQPRVPLLEQDSDAANEIDHFVRARLRQAGLSPSPPADRERLLRRVTVDLTGLPPTLSEMNAFLADDSEDAYERVVDRLLESPACAERLALDWMDLARYADSHGLHADGWRRMWPWRDWVISAFHQNLPYDDFVTWQIAGDLLPDATDEQILATAFHRNHPMTAEGGVIDEEFRLLYVFDRVETTATAFLGLTIQCARCHDHKFDPIRQQEYYELSAFYNNIRELGMTGDDGNYGPYMLLPTDPQAERLAALDRQIADSEAQLMRLRRAARGEFTGGSGEPTAADACRVAPASHRFPLDGASRVAEGENNWKLDDDESATTSIEPELIDAVDGKGVLIRNEYGYLSLQGVGQFDTAESFTAALWVRPDQQLSAVPPAALRTILGTAGQKNQQWRGWEFDLDGRNRLVVRLIHSLPENLIDVRSRDPLPIGEWSHVAFSYDGTGGAAGVSISVAGRAVPLVVLEDGLDRSILPIQHAIGFPTDEERAVRVGRSYRAFTGEFGIFSGGIDDIRMWDASLTQLEIGSLLASYGGAGEGGELSPPDSEGRFEHWLLREHGEYGAAADQLRALRSEQIRLRSEIPELMVMREMPQPRPTYLLHRGEYTQPRQQVTAGTPAAVLPFPEGLPRNRLGLARWLFYPGNSLTARVAVNRYWQLLFGQGLVRTPHDFGVQGERPTHPELLDWLAVTFRESGWDVRGLLRRMVTSATYRQSSVVRPELRESDPQNRLLGRSPAYRLPAEVIRDQALAASGLLVQSVGGPSVKPYQPAGLWIEKNNFSQYLLNYKADQGEKLYRRSLYTFIRRTSPPPAMIALDATNRSVCTVKREVTNTPLQALVLLNDPQFVEAARMMAVRIQREGGASPQERITFAVRLLTGRHPRSDELVVLERLFSEQLQRFETDPAAATALLQVGDHPRAEDLGEPATAAWTMVANTLMNYDEFYMKR